MKKVLYLLFVLTLVFSLTACGPSEAEMSNEAYKKSKEALSIMDKYLDGNYGKKAAQRDLESIYEELSDLGPNSGYKTPMCEASIRGALRSLEHGDHTPFADPFIEKRNLLAKTIGARERNE